MSNKSTYREEMYNEFTFHCAHRFLEILDAIGKDMNWARKEMGYPSYNAGVNLKTKKDSRVSTVIRFCRVIDPHIDGGMTPARFFEGVNKDGNNSTGPVMVQGSPNAVTTTGQGNQVNATIGSQNGNHNLKLENNHLKQTLELKDKLIKSLENQIKLLAPP